MKDDMALLRDFVTSDSEDAFRELVRRRIAFVHAVAWRITRNRASAEDATQIVFGKLVKSAKALLNRTSLLGWLHSSAHNAAVDLVRSEASRRAREQAGLAEIGLANEFPPETWDKIWQHLDPMIENLDEATRTAVLLRFFDQKAWTEIGLQLRVSENAARMRVERGLEKLHQGLLQKGVTCTAAIISTALGQTFVNSTSNFAAEIASAALVAGHTGAGAQLISPAVVGATIGLLLLGAAGWHFWPKPTPVQVVVPMSSVLAALGRLPADSGRSADSSTSGAVDSRSGAFDAKGFTADPRIAEDNYAPQRRAIQNNLRMIAAARSYFLKLQGRLPDTIDELVGPLKFIRELKTIDGEDYRTVALGAAVLAVATMNSGIVTLDAGPPRPEGPPDLTEQKAWNDELLAYGRASLALDAIKIGDTINEHDAALIAVAEVMRREGWQSGIRTFPPQRLEPRGGQLEGWLVNINRWSETDARGNPAGVHHHVRLTVSADGTINPRSYKRSEGRTMEQIHAENKRRQEEQAATRAALP